jgi:integrase
LEIGLENFERLEMPSKREKTNYPGVFYRIAERKGKPGEERVYYIVFKQDGKVVEEKAGRQFADNMTPAKAAGRRAERIEGKRRSRKEIREQALADKQAEAAKNTIGKLWEMYKASLPDRNDWITDTSLYRLYLKNEFSSKILDEIRTTDIDALRQRTLKLGKSPQTVKHILGLLRRIIRFGVKKGLCQAPDQSKLYFEMPTVDNQKTENLNSVQLKKYIEAIDREEDQNAAALLRLALSTGMRKGALLALRWDDIDFEHGFITLRGDAAKKGKTERIPLTKTARDILSHVERSRSAYIFPGKDGEQRKDFRRIARRVKKNAGLPDDFRPLHGLRHAFASFLASSGQVDLYTLQKLLTHGSPQMTQRYAHLADEALQRAVNVIDTCLLPNPKEKK